MGLPDGKTNAPQSMAAASKADGVSIPGEDATILYKGGSRLKLTHRIQ